MSRVRTFFVICFVFPENHSTLYLHWLKIGVVPLSQLEQQAKFKGLSEIPLNCLVCLAF